MRVRALISVCACVFACFPLTDMFVHCICTRDDLIAIFYYPIRILFWRNHTIRVGKLSKNVSLTKLCIDSWVKAQKAEKILPKMKRKSLFKAGLIKTCFFWKKNSLAFLFFKEKLFLRKTPKPHLNCFFASCNITIFKSTQ